MIETEGLMVMSESTMVLVLLGKKCDQSKKGCKVSHASAGEESYMSSCSCIVIWPENIFQSYCVAQALSRGEE